MTDTRKWSAVAAVLVVAIFAAGWFLLISPKRGDAATLRDTAAAKAQANGKLEEQIKMLQQQQQDLPTQQATLAALRTKIPTNPALPALIRDLTVAGQKAGVSLDSMAPSPPVAVVSAAAAPAVTSSSNSTEGDSTSSATDSTSSTPKSKAPEHAAAPTEALFQVPLTLNVTGSYFELEQFISKLENIQRSFLVSGFTIADATTEGTVDGDLTVVLNGRVFLSQAVQPTTTASVAAPATSTAK
jgi:Tfp pilus assembly protein PilO